MRFRTKMTTTIAGVALLSMVASACTGSNTSSTQSSVSAPNGSSSPEQIAQPDVGSLAVAPPDARADLTAPTFSDPTNVTNPLFPVSEQRSVLFLGHVDGLPFRTEVTLLPRTSVIQWNGMQIETLESQYMAFLDGRITEIALDYYAQADDGSVWYFGEDVSDFEDGAIVSTEGTWRAGVDGPAAMIMSGDPQVGDAFRTENTPGIAFEEVSVRSTGQTFDGPFGPIAGGITVSELHMDGTSEDKLFAPGYGEFRTSGEGDLEALALAVPTDASTGPVPDEVQALSDGAMAIFESVGAGEWQGAADALRPMDAAWATYRPSGPRLIAPWLDGVLADLRSAIDRRAVGEARQAAIEVARSSLDMQLPFRPVEEINEARFDLWISQLEVDVAARDQGALRGDVFTLDLILDRIQSGMEPAQVGQIHTLLEDVRTAVNDGAMRDAARAIQDLRTARAE